MPFENLTKKNQDYIHIATKQLMKDGKSDAEVKELIEEMIPVLLENQAKGIPARALFGSPTAWAEAQSKPEETASQPEQNDHPLAMWLDSALFILGAIGLIMGAVTYFSPTSQPYGLLTMLDVAVVGGAVLYGMYHFIYRKIEEGQRPKLWRSVLITGILVIAWSLSFAVIALIPASLNPVIPPLGMVLIGAVALAIRYYLKKRFNIKSASANPRPVR